MAALELAELRLGSRRGERWGVPIAAFIGALVVALVLQLVLQTRCDLGAATIILVGVSMSALSGALIHLLVANAREDSLVRSALFLVLADTAARSAFGPVVVQTGVVAALVGAPIFLVLLLRRRQT